MARKNRRKPAAECVYCGKFGEVTQDHVPPKSLFPSPRPSNLITVPSCKSCNNGASRDDEYFRKILVMREDVEGHPATERILSSVLSGLARPQQRKFNREFIESISFFWRRSTEGIFIGRYPAYRVKTMRLLRVLNRINRGLYYHEQKKRIPTNYLVKSVIDVSDDDWRLTSSPMDQPFRSIGEDVFLYRSHYAEASQFAVLWQFIIYGTIRAVSVSHPPSPPPSARPLQIPSNPNPRSSKPKL